MQELRVDNPVAEIRGMKDVRVTQLRNGKIAVFTRPTTGEAYPGRVGFALIDTLQQIEKAANVPLLTFQIDKDAKIGLNEAHEDGQEIFDFERGIIHYAGYAFILDPNHPFDKIIGLHKVADRSDFPVNNKVSKGSRFEDVIFPGGTGGPGQTQYYCGVEDARIGVIDII